MKLTFCPTLSFNDSLKVHIKNISIVTLGEGKGFNLLRNYLTWKQGYQTLRMNGWMFCPMKKWLKLQFYNENQISSINHHYSRFKLHISSHKANSSHNNWQPLTLNKKLISFNMSHWLPPLSIERRARYESLPNIAHDWSQGRELLSFCAKTTLSKIFYV